MKCNPPSLPSPSRSGPAAQLTRAVSKWPLKHAACRAVPALRGCRRRSRSRSLLRARDSSSPSSSSRAASGGSCWGGGCTLCCCCGCSDAMAVGAAPHNSPYSHSYGIVPVRARILAMDGILKAGRRSVCCRSSTRAPGPMCGCLVWAGAGAGDAVAGC